MKNLRFLTLLGLATCATPAFAQGTTVDKGDSVWMIVATALVLLMTPALALFYGGMVRKKNVLNTMLLSFVMMGVISIVWALLGFSLSFGKSHNGFIGGLDYLWGNGISVTAAYGALTIPAALFMLFQMKFAIITPALISGAIAERVRFGAYLLFMVLWSVLIYCPLACWVWNSDGWLFKLGALDFAGGTVVHLSSGISAIAFCMVLGPRKDKSPAPNNLTLTLLGAGMLWFGWFGFNAGSALAMNDIAINSFLTTHLAAGAGLIGWMLVETMRHGRPTALGAASGLVAGLVGITPAAGFVGIVPGILIGLIAGVGCCFAIELKHKMGLDDALDVIGVHGIGGLLGSILTGVFADRALNPAVPDVSRGQIIVNQLVAVGAAGAFAFAGSLVLAWLVNKVTKLRADDEHEVVGLDTAVHGESGYTIDENFVSVN